MTPPPSLYRRSSIIEYLSNLPIRPRLPSIRSRTSRKSTASSLNSFAAAFLAANEQSMLPAILRNADVTNKLLEYIVDSPNGRRSLARLARTCKAFKEPALNVLWRELDSFVPLLALFPNALMKRSRRPGLGLSKTPEPADWERLLAYADRVRSITYNEAYNNVAPTIFAVIEELRPKQFILPKLTALTWKAETAAGLERSRLFLNPGLQSLTIEMGNKYTKMGDFLNYIMEKTALTT
ncbi:hypothetical protein EIP91_006360, partial [Steccherinum ochraceum]